MGRFVKAQRLASSNLAVLLPDGSGMQRPEREIEGYIRYSYDINNFEYYNGTEWRPLGADDSSFYSKEVWIGDGVSQQFPLPSLESSEETLSVYVNGVYQEFNEAYNIADDIATGDPVISFIAPPPPGMRIVAITRAGV